MGPTAVTETHTVLTAKEGRNGPCTEGWVYEEGASPGESMLLTMDGLITMKIPIGILGTMRLGWKGGKPGAEKLPW